MKDITALVKQAIAVDAVWNGSDFFHFLEKLNERGFKNTWEDGEYCTCILINEVIAGYIWKRYPLVFVREDYADQIMKLAKNLDYIVFIESKDLVTAEFKLEMDQELLDRIFFLLNIQGFSANDFWFYMINW